MHKLPGKIYRIAKLAKDAKKWGEKDKCPQCDAPINPMLNKCHKCGFQLFCSICGEAIVEITWNNCQKCGQVIEKRLGFQ